jgi:hypothetical protein
LQLLAECRVRRRAEILLKAVMSLAAAPAKSSALVFPPSFSDN